MEIKKINVAMKDNSKKLSIASGPVIINNDKVLLVRGKEGTHFKFPGGYIIDNENFKETAIREAKEEINCEIEVSGDPVFYFLNNPADSLDIFLIHYKAKIIFGEPSPSTEIEEVKWFDINNLPENVMENVIPVVLNLRS